LPDRRKSQILDIQSLWTLQELQFSLMSFP
jgi:hypothetical protein